MNQPQPISQETVFSGRVIETRVDTLLMPDGKQITREVVQHPGAVAIIPIDTEDNVLLVRQYRYAAGQSLLELPAGVIEEWRVAGRHRAARAAGGDGVRFPKPPSARRRLLVTRVLHGVLVPVHRARPRPEPTAGRRGRRHHCRVDSNVQGGPPDQAR